MIDGDDCKMVTVPGRDHQLLEEAPLPLPPHVRSHETTAANDDWTWLVSFGAAMVPFTAFLMGHQRGWTVRVVNAVVKSPVGPAGLLLLPFCTLAMEKSIYDTVQAAQGMDPTCRPVDRGGFPSGGAELLPSFSLIPVQKRPPPPHHQPQQNGGLE